MKLIITTILFFNITMTWSQDLFKHVKYGAYNIEFYSIILEDSTRIWDESLELNRNIQLQMWYPSSKESNKSSMLYSDYFEFLGNSDNYKEYPNPKERGEQMHYYPARYFKADSIELVKLSDLKMRAVPYTKIDGKEKYPVIFFNQGASGSPINNVGLFELLASHGYIVISYPTQKIDYKTKFTDDIEQGLFNQEEDLKLIYNYSMANFDNIDDSKIHFAGVSSGTIAFYNLIRDLKLNVQSITSLDGSLTSQIMEPFLGDFELPIFNCNTLVAISTLERKNVRLIKGISSKSSKLLIIQNLRHSDFSCGPLIYRIVDNFYGKANPEFIYSYEYLVAEILQTISQGKITNKLEANSSIIVNPGLD